MRRRDQRLCKLHNVVQTTIWDADILLYSLALGRHGTAS